MLELNQSSVIKNILLKILSGDTKSELHQHSDSTPNF